MQTSMRTPADGRFDVAEELEHPQEVAWLEARHVALQCVTQRLGNAVSLTTEDLDQERAHGLARPTDELDEIDSFDDDIDDDEGYEDD